MWCGVGVRNFRRLVPLSKPKEDRWGLRHTKAYNKQKCRTRQCFCGGSVVSAQAERVKKELGRLALFTLSPSYFSSGCCGDFDGLGVRCSPPKGFFALLCRRAWREDRGSPPQRFPLEKGALRVPVRGETVIIIITAATPSRFRRRSGTLVNRWKCGTQRYVCV